MGKSGHRPMRPEGNLRVPDCVALANTRLRDGHGKPLLEVGGKPQRQGQRGGAAYKTLTGAVHAAEAARDRAEEISREVYALMRQYEEMCDDNRREVQGMCTRAGLLCVLSAISCLVQWAMLLFTR